MSEKKLTRCPFGVIALNMPDPAMEFYKASDADALLAERDAEIARLRAQIEADLKERNTVVELGNAYGKAQYENVGRLGDMLKEANAQLTAHREAVRVLAEECHYRQRCMDRLEDNESRATADKLISLINARNANPIASTALRSAGEEGGA